MSPTPDDTSYEPYRINTLQEVDGILSQLLQQGALLRMHNGNAQYSVITTLLDLDFDNETIVIDSAAQQTINQQLIASETAYFDTLLNGVAIKFQVQSLYGTFFEDRPALAGSLPSYLYRIQRRENFRIRPTLENTPQCLLTINDESQQLEVYDISSKGLALIDPHESLTDHIGKTLTNCQLVLPGVGEVTIDLRLVRSQTQALQNHKKLPLIGCAFSSPDSNQQIRIQHFITNEERLQIARERGLA